MSAALDCVHKYGIADAQACWLDVAGFPNLNAISLETDLGERYLEPLDFMTRGAVASVITTIVIVTVGYAISRAMGL